MLFRAGRGLFAIACAWLAGVSLARAADIPYAVQPYPAAAWPASWAGFYLGGQVGWGGDDVRWRNLSSSTYFSPLNWSTHDHRSGIIGGGQLGYNFQYGRIVWGLEASMSAADFDRSFTSPYYPATDVWSSKLTWLGTATGRVGYGFDSWLPYIKAGLAAGNVNTTIQDNGAGVMVQGSSVHYGWTAGAGVEFKIAPGFSLGLEFMHTDLGRSNDINGPRVSTATGAPAAGSAESFGVGLRSNSIMARFNYLFGGR